MNVRLMHTDRPFDRHAAVFPHAEDVTHDLALESVWAAMAGRDEFLHEAARLVLLSGSDNDIETVRYRQEVLQDCLDNPAVVRALYGIATQALEARLGAFWFTRSASGVLSSSLDVLQILTQRLRQLRRLADGAAGSFNSRGFLALFGVLREELPDEYLATVAEHLASLRFREGVWLSARLGLGNAGTDYVLHRPPRRHTSWLERLLGWNARGHTVRLDPQDDAGARIVAELRDQGLSSVAATLAQVVDHVMSFFETLRWELGFYVGCLNLRDRLEALGVPMTLPSPALPGTRRLRAVDLHDVSLALTIGRRPVGNDFDATEKVLVVITGANQGGKSTFLRSVGLAQLMMQSGMFVGAASFTAELCRGLFTHFKREEDPALQMGKLDEELARMSAIAAALRPEALVLFNESFAATNEREGSEIARQVIRALTEKGVKVFFVTHLWEFARSLAAEARQDVLFLRAERQVDGRRTFRLQVGAPLPTSHASDVYRIVFGEPLEEAS
jgi:hypothetical protein